MQVLDLEEQEDGSAIVTLDMKAHEVGFFIEMGVIEAIKRGALETKKGLKGREAWEESRAVPEDASAKELHLQGPEEGTEEEGGAE